MSMYTGLSGIKAANTDLNTTSHNIANAGTTGFKNSRAEFGDLVDSNAALGGGLGVKAQAVNQLFQQGGVITTGNALDLAITGNGFFQVQGGGDDGQTLYTRAGSFHVAADGRVVNNLGQQLQGTEGPLQFEADSLPLSNITVNDDGTITATGSGGEAVSPEGGAVGLVDFPNPQGLKKISDTQWAETVDSGAPTDIAAPPGNIGTIMSGALEASNVDLTEQLVNMIIAQRNFQANAQTITTENTLTQTVINIR
ncbi:MAG: flagellar hook basal-body protein [Gammaproteobacteria bacterium]|nr:flagellar hook basal-body protein [Gammaproteobacteria bacterium]MCP5195469.1 flagellar hook basal-body protein [Gammaproteobacteria bacterium]